MSSSVLIERMQEVVTYLESNAARPTAIATASVRIEELLEHIRGSYNAFQDTPPPGLEPLQELMLEGLSLFEQGLLEMAAFTEDQDPAHLGRAMELAHEGEDLLLSVDYLVDNAKQELEQHVSA
jgi:hypothetical protein